METTITTPAEEQRYAELQLLALEHARTGDTEPLAAMIRHGLPVNLADAKGNSLLMLAAYHQNPATVRMLLEKGAEVDRRNHRGQTPLGGAAFKGYAEIVTLLLDSGAEIDADNGAGMTPIMFAAMFGRTQVVAQLQAHGASLQRRNRLGLSAGFIIRATGWLVRWFRGSSMPVERVKKPLRPPSIMKTDLPSLITPDAAAGLALARQLSEQLHEQFKQANVQVEHPGGTNYMLAAPVPVEVISSVLFYAISAANHGWAPTGRTV